MKKVILSVGFKILLVLVSLFYANKTIAQSTTYSRKEKVIMPAFLQEEKKRTPVRFGIGIETYASGNAHGAFYSARLYLSKGKSVFGLGPSLQKRTLEINGIKASYSYLLSGINNRYTKEEIEEMKNDPADILELRVMCYVQYLHDCGLSYYASRVETVTNKESKVNFNTVRLSTIEAAACAEIDINIKWFKIRTYMGFTTFYHTNYIKGMYRAKCSPALTFGAGIIIPNL